MDFSNAFSLSADVVLDGKFKIKSSLIQLPLESERTDKCFNIVEKSQISIPNIFLVILYFLYCIHFLKINMK